MMLFVLEVWFAGEWKPCGEYKSYEEAWRERDKVIGFGDRFRVYDKYATLEARACCACGAH